MPSKGIDVYSYIGEAVDGFEISFSVPGEQISRKNEDNFTSYHLEVDKKNLLGLTDFTGRFEWKALCDGEEVFGRYEDINTLTGNLHGGNMAATHIQQSIIAKGVVISYGFYDAGHGIAGLTSHDQCYVTIVSLDRHRAWMSQLVPPGSEAEQKPFSRFALVAPHDDGMNSMETCDAVLYSRDEDTVKELAKHIPAIGWFAEHMSNTVLAHMLPNLIYGVSVTQKDTVPTMLALGARYFEYRPAHLLPMLQEVSEHVPNKPYFQHACIPGLAFDEFLQQIVTFLDENPSEHVVTHIRWDNIVSECKRPTMEELDAAYDAACATAQSGNLCWGKQECFSQSVASLRADGRRLIRVIDLEKYDSWAAKPYATLHADTIISQFESMDTAGQEATDITVLQCQATSQSIKEVLLYSVLASNADTSCLTSTKGDLDRHTLPWIRDNALNRLKADKLVVVMNDFIDGATTDTVIGLNQGRFAVRAMAEGKDSVETHRISGDDTDKDVEDIPAIPGAFVEDERDIPLRITPTQPS